jgi:molybdate transport system permease protein
MSRPPIPLGPFLNRTDRAFYFVLAVIGGAYPLLIVALLVADATFTTPSHLRDALLSPEIRFAVHRSLLTCTLSAILSVWVAVPLGYLMSRTRFPGKAALEAILDVPIVLPPLVIGLALLILFQTPPGRAVQQVVPVTFAVPGVVLAQFTVAAAFAVRTMRMTFDQVPVRAEHLALTLGCSSAQAFWLVALPQARRGILAAAILAWARSLGEFGPILIFAGATRFRTEVMPTSVFLELSVGHIEGAVAVSLLMVIAAGAVLALARGFGLSHNHLAVEG